MLNINEMMYFFCLKSISVNLRRQIYDKICDFFIPLSCFFRKNILRYNTVILSVESDID